MPGIIFESGSIWTSLSKMCSAMLLLGKRLKKCGSIDVMSAATAIFKSAAKTEAQESTDARTPMAMALPEWMERIEIPRGRWVRRTLSVKAEEASKRSAAHRYRAGNAPFGGGCLRRP